jgi:hypothetical protein
MTPRNRRGTGLGTRGAERPSTQHQKSHGSGVRGQESLLGAQMNSPTADSGRPPAPRRRVCVCTYTSVSRPSTWEIKNNEASRLGFSNLNNYTRLQKKGGAIGTGGPRGAGPIRIECHAPQSHRPWTPLSLVSPRTAAALKNPPIIVACRRWGGGRGRAGLTIANGTVLRLNGSAGRIRARSQPTASAPGWRGG